MTNIFSSGYLSLQNSCFGLLIYKIYHVLVTSLSLFLNFASWKYFLFARFCHDSFQRNFSLHINSHYSCLELTPLAHLKFAFPRVTCGNICVPHNIVSLLYLRFWFLNAVFKKTAELSLNDLKRFSIHYHWTAFGF